MKPPYAHVSRTVLVFIAAAGAVWLSAFFLPGSGVQPVPLLPVIGSVAGKVVAVAEPRHVSKHKATPRQTTAAAAPTPVSFTPPATAPQTVVRATPRVVHRRHRARPPHHGVKPKRHRPVQTAAPASAPATATSVSYAPAAHAPRGRALGWHRKHEDSTTTTTTAAPTHGHGKSQGKNDDAPSAQPAAAPTPAPALPATPPPATGHDNGQHRGDNHDHGDQGHGPGGRK